MSNTQARENVGSICQFYDLAYRFRRTLPIVPRGSIHPVLSKISRWSVSIDITGRNATEYIRSVFHYGLVSFYASIEGGGDEVNKGHFFKFFSHRNINML